MKLDGKYSPHVLASEDKDRLWDEYKHSYQLVWDTVLKLTAAVVLVSIVPYTNREVACVLGSGALAAPAVAILLALFGYKCLKPEVETWKLIRAEHRKAQNLIPLRDETFGKHVKGFLIMLIIAAFANAGIVQFIWRPAVAPVQGQPSSCFSTQSSASDKSAPQQESTPQR